MRGTAGTRTRTATVISSTPATQASLYTSGGTVLAPVPGFESDCSVAVRYDDGTTATVSAAEEPVPLVEQIAPFVGYAALQVLVNSDWGDGDSWQRAEERHDELLEELRKDESERAAAPASGEYWGSSDESDAGDQAVRSKLTFKPDGSIVGSGVDGVDGGYRVTRGRWGRRSSSSPLDSLSPSTTVAWIEEYNEGFKVAVKGQYDESTGEIKARFISSRGVSGSFELAPKPSIFG